VQGRKQERRERPADRERGCMEGSRRGERGQLTEKEGAWKKVQ